MPRHVSVSGVAIPPILKGHGKVWARNFRIEVVSDLATATNIPQQPGESRRLPSQPINLDFDADAA